jgi:hypothetical protein
MPPHDQSPSSLPEPYATWLSSALEAEVPPETVATCDDCVMLPREGLVSPRSLGMFSPDTKCCTYIPNLPNFRVGALLRDRAPGLAQSQALLREQCRRGVGVSPLGVQRSVVQDTLYELGKASFGRNPGLRCPHLDAAGGCGIWAHRNAVCATYFCKHNRASVGARFWGRVRDLLAEAERALSYHCVLEELPGPDTLDALSPLKGREHAPPVAEELDPLLTATHLARLWGPLRGKEPEYFERCAERVDALTWDEVRALGGVQLALCEDLVQRAFEALCSDRLPHAVVVGEYSVVHADETWIYLAALPLGEPVRAPRRLIEHLHGLGQGSLDDALARIAEQANLHIAPALVRTLLDYGILLAR